MASSSFWTSSLARAAAPGLGLALSLTVSAAAGPLARIASPTVRLPANLQPPNYTTIEAFPGMSLNGVVAIASPPGETNRLFLVEQFGQIVVITNLAAPTRTVFLDLTLRVLAGGEAGLLGLAFHPNYRVNGQFFVFYTVDTVSTNLDGSRNQGFHDRLSRFVVASHNPNRGDAGSETVLISQYDRAENHNGGDVHFGPDGYLYVSLGDEGGGGDNYGNGQRIDLNFFSAILRLDVDKRPGSLPANPHAAATAHYRVPADNPFIGATSFNGQPIDPTRVRTEFWAIGLRNPWRFSFDPGTGDLLCGDVGQGAREEVNRIVRGGNYGWNYFEGTLPYAGTPPARFSDIKPIVDYGRPSVSSDPERQGYTVIGGVVYRGSRLPELYGQYLFGDYGTGFVWALQSDGTNATDFRRLLAGSAMTCFGTDPRNGDLLMASSTILRLVASGPSQQPPASLGATGLFADVASLQPAPGIVPYEVNVPFWSDHASKRRWFSLPDIASTMTFRSEANWFFPAGAVWVKHFDLEMSRGVPASARRIETRVLVKTSTGVYGLSYRWGGAANDATLVPTEGLDEEFEVIEGTGTSRQRWRYPGRSECLTCHTPAGGLVLGFNAAQLNREVVYGSTQANQLVALSEAGYFSNPIGSPEQLARLAAATDPSASVEHRVRSYLAANCAQCHQPGGLTAGFWDARIHTPTAQAGLINGRLNDNGGNPLAAVIRPGSLANSMLYTRISHRGPGQMPPLASGVLDTANAALVAQWITNGLTGEPIVLEISGDGTIRGPTNGQRLKAGKSYTVTAVPAALQVFSHWSGGIESTQNPLRFEMRPGLVLRANFIRNPFLELPANYLGMFHELEQVQPDALARTYSTTFASTENPLSEGGNWITGKAVGLDWSDIRTTNGMALGLQIGNQGTDDSTALLTGTWGPNQMGRAIVHTTNLSGIVNPEVEIRLRSSLSPHRCTGYEVLFSLRADSPYISIVRWNGPFNDWTILNWEIGSAYVLHDGDEVMGVISNQTITAFINGVAVLQASDSTYSSGNPGIGIFLAQTTGVNADYGFTSFTASDELGSTHAQNVSTARGGGIAVTVAKSGGFSARLELGGVRLPFSGRFDLNRTATNSIVHPQLGLFIVELSLIDTFPVRVSGRVRAPGWTAGLEALPPTQAVPPIRFTWASELDETNPDAPPGESFGSVRAVGTRVTLDGTMADGGRFSRATVLSQDGRMLFCVPRFGRSSSVFGWATLSPDGSRFAGHFTWGRASSNPPQPVSEVLINVPLAGSIHWSTNRLAPETIVDVTCSQGGLTTPVVNSVVVDGPGPWTNQDPSRPARTSFKIDWNTGFFSGKFVDPETQQSHPIKGAILWQDQRGAGFFPANGTNGRVEVRF